MPPRPKDQRELFMALGEDLRFALRCGIGWDGAIAVLQDQIALLQSLRDRGVDPQNF